MPPFTKIDSAERCFLAVAAVATVIFVAAYAYAFVALT